MVFSLDPKPAVRIQIESFSRNKYEINKYLENKENYSRLYLDISKVSDKVWHTGLLYNIKKYLPLRNFTLLQLYLNDRYFQIRVNDKIFEP